MDTMLSVLSDPAPDLPAAVPAPLRAICQRCLNELDEKVWTIARSKGSASERLERLELEVFAYHKENLLEEQKVNDIVMVAMEESWDAIMAHKERIRSVIEDDPKNPRRVLTVRGAGYVFARKQDADDRADGA